MSENLITERDILDEARDNFLVYAGEVLSDRAIPSSEDGLLPVHRKLIWTMEKVLKMDNKGKTKKSASVVGSTLAAAYTHGDSACYGALCKMAQAYLMRYPLVEGQGQLGTQEANGMQASARYTESKPSAFADLMMNDFDKGVVPLKETYNGEYYEPVVLPSLFPNAIVNGKESIGLSMAHSSLPNNLTETCNAIVAYIKNPSMDIDELLTYIPAPDFPLGNVITNIKDVKEAFRTGKSKVSLKVRGDYEVKGDEIIFTSIPYRTYRNKIKEQINNNIDELEKYFDDFRDESNVGKNKMIFTMAKGVTEKAALSKLFALTDLETSLSYNMNYIVNGTPKLCSMLDLIDAYVVHQENVLIKATQFDKEKAEKRAEILEGLIIASDNIDKVIHIIRNATDKNDAAEKLKQNFQILTEEQIKAILNMKLSSLTKMDKHELEKELEEKKAIIKRCGEILESKELRDSIIIEKVEWLRDKYGDERRTTYNNSFYSEKDEVEYIPEKCILTLYDNMTFKRTPVTNLKVQKRKGKGVKSTDGTILSTIETNTTDRVLMFTRAGKMYQAKVGELAENKIIRATSLVNLDAGDEIVSITSFNKETKCDYICFTTSKGMFKKSLLGEYNTNKKAGIKAISFKDDDDFLVDVSFVVDENVIMFSDNGKCICFNTDLVNPIGRSAKGVVAMKLEEGERIISVVYPREGDQYICLTNKRGYSKKIKIEDFNVQNRGGKGVKYYSFDFLSAIVVNDGDLIVAQGEPNSITIKSEDIVVTSKTARGTQIIKDSILTEITKIESED